LEEDTAIWKPTTNDNKFYITFSLGENS